MNNNKIINEEYLHSLLELTADTNTSRTDDILNKALELKGLELEEVANLLNISDSQSLEKLFNTAYQIKNTIYGNRVVLFAPVYVSNFCSNNCLYCGFRKDNKKLHRSCLTIAQLKEEVKIILEQGHKRILMLMGEESEECSLDYFIETLEAAYSVKDAKGSSIRRINIEIAPLNESEFKKISNLELGTYTVFQESYHKPTYDKMHPSGIKSDYNKRLHTMDLALSNGMKDIGIGALFGLYDYRFEVLALIRHAQYLDRKYGVGPHTISIPRIEEAQNAPISTHIPSPVSDIDFQKLVAVLRCAVPYTGMILSTRESPEIRKKVLKLGVSQMSAGSKTGPGGYKKSKSNPIAKSQFSLNDNRSTGEVINSVIKQGFVPSFCTACYRLGRVGKDFMDLAKPGLIKAHCHPNALVTLEEYLQDYADAETVQSGHELIQKEIENTNNPKLREYIEASLKRIRNGDRDIYC